MPDARLRLLVSGDTAVRVFIIVSGFVITHLLIARREAYGPYLLRRFLRLAPIYLFCLLLALLIFQFYRLAYVDNPLPVGRAMRIDRFQQEEAHFGTHLLLHLSLLHSLVPDTILPYASTAFLAPAWSLSLEWQFYLIAPLLIGIALRSGMAGLGLAAALVAIKFGLNRWHGLSWQYEGFFFLAGDLFMIGILSRIALQRFHLRQGRAGLGALLLVGAYRWIETPPIRLGKRLVAAMPERMSSASGSA